MDTQELCELLSVHEWRIIKKKEELESPCHETHDEVFVKATGKSEDGIRLTLTITVKDIISDPSRFILSFEIIHTITLDKERTYHDPEKGDVIEMTADRWNELMVKDIPKVFSEIDTTYGRVKAGA
ncbi:MAG: hypothetical protein HGB03_02250 [Candidatus Yonathbacteria bacterium]|nr:hypothetical protein [Candidatus Yonathbacteria bacterium]NTW47538.1 hypothetical protein [Candidatus Yonathbacteria bacterium]